MSNITIDVSSEKQTGGTTSGIINNQDVTIKKLIWKSRREGFFSALGLAVIVEIIIRLIF